MKLTIELFKQIYWKYTKGYKINEQKSKHRMKI